MKRTGAPICEVCGMIKGNANRWLVGLVKEGMVCLMPWPKDHEPSDERMVALCSDTDALRWQSRRLDEMGR